MTMKHLIIGMALFLLVVSAWAGTLTDNFDDGNLEGWQLAKLFDQTAQWSVENGELVCVLKNACGRASSLLLGDDTWKNYTLEAQFKVEQIFSVACNSSTASIGVHFEETDKISQISLGVFGRANVNVWGEVTCAKEINGNPPLPGNLEFPHVGNLVTELGRWYTMRIVADENRYEMFIDNKRICDVWTDLPDKGAAGVGSRNSKVHFDNVVIMGDEIPDKNLGLPVDPKAKLTAMWATIKQNR